MDAATAVGTEALRILVALLFVCMGMNHFRRAPARTMAAMIPPTLRRSKAPTPLHLVYFTGVCEIAGGLGILFPATRLPAALALIVFLVAVFPANTYAARHPEKFGRAAIPLGRRYFAQLVLILIVLLAGV